MRGWDNLNKVSQLMYKETYFLKDETYDEWLERVCSAYSSDNEHKKRMKNYIKSFCFIQLLLLVLMLEQTEVYLLVALLGI
jgi:hypothetical protein